MAARNQAAWLSAGTLFCNLLLSLSTTKAYYCEVWTNNKLPLLLQTTTTTTAAAAPDATFPARQFFSQVTFCKKLTTWYAKKKEKFCNCMSSFYFQRTLFLFLITQVSVNFIPTTSRLGSLFFLTPSFTFLARLFTVTFLLYSF